MYDLCFCVHIYVINKLRVMLRVMGLFEGISPISDPYMLKPLK